MCNHEENVKYIKKILDDSEWDVEMQDLASNLSCYKDSTET